MKYYNMIALVKCNEKVVDSFIKTVIYERQFKNFKNTTRELKPVSPD